jgi:hypothetical protein
MWQFSRQVIMRLAYVVIGIAFANTLEIYPLNDYMIYSLGGLAIVLGLIASINSVTIDRD